MAAPTWKSGNEVPILYDRSSSSGFTPNHGPNLLKRKIQHRYHFSHSLILLTRPVVSDAQNPGLPNMLHRDAQISLFVRSVRRTSSAKHKKNTKKTEKKKQKRCRNKQGKAATRVRLPIILVRGKASHLKRSLVDARVPPAKRQVDSIRLRELLVEVY